MGTMRSLRFLALVLALGAVASPLRAQTDGTCIPASERGDRTFGCFILDRHEMGRLLVRPPLYWHVDTYATRADAERARQRDRWSTVVESLGKTWVLTIAPFAWKAVDAEHWVSVGPLPAVDTDSAVAIYMEVVYQPGMQSMVHRHEGGEGWFVLDGAVCVETPDGAQRQQPGEPGIVTDAGVPMQATATGTTPLRALVVVLQDASKPRSVAVTDWVPKRACRE